MSFDVLAQSGRQPDAAMKRAPVEGGELEYEVQGEGEPVLLIHGGVIAASYVPLMREPALGRYRLIRYHRRGYAGSTKPAPGASVSIANQAADALSLLRHLEIERAHVVGHSYGGVIALQLALDAPGVVRSLTLLEPAMVRFAPSGAAFGKETMGPPMARYHAGDHTGALDIFMRDAVATDWKRALARTIPGSIEQAERDVRTTFEIETRAHGEWDFGEQKARTISQPILHIVGGDSHAMFQEIRKVLHSWFPQQVEDLAVPGVAHGLHQMGGPYSAAVAEGMSRFLRRHPIAGAKP
jgi:pimeloyl-ACP methyl ester carboxylesterase